MTQRTTQAQRIFNRFGGVRPLAAALEQLAEHTGDDAARRDPSTIYRWDYPKSRGGYGGVIPSSALGYVMSAAELIGVQLTAEDVDPRPRSEEDIFQ